MPFDLMCYIALLGTSLFAFFANNFSFANDFRINKKVYNKNFVFFAFALIAFLAAIRTGWGDTGHYMRYTYPTIGTSGPFSNIEDPVSNFFIYCLYQISPNPQLFVVVTSVIIYSSIFHFFSKYSMNLTITVFTFVASTAFEMTMNGIIQYTAAAVYFFAVEAAMQKRPLKYIIITIICVLIHQSAIVMLPLYWIINTPLWSRRTKIFAATGAVLAVTYSFWLPAFNRLLSYTRMNHYFVEISNVDGIHPLRLAVMFVPVLLSWIARKNIHKNYPQYEPLVNVTIINFIFYALGYNHWLFSREAFYSEIFVYISLPVLLKCAFEKQSQKYVNLFVYIFYFLFLLYHLHATRSGGFFPTIFN